MGHAKDGGHGVDGEHDVGEFDDGQDEQERRRDAGAVLGDVIEGYVSPAQARDVYGVEIDKRDWTVNTDATSKIRGALRAAALSR